MAKNVPVLLSAKSLASFGAIVNFATGQAVMQNLNNRKVVQMERSDTGHLWFSIFDEMPIVSDDPYDLIDHGHPENMMAHNYSIAASTASPSPATLQSALATQPATTAS